MPDQRPASAEGDFILEEHSAEPGSDEAAVGLELDEFQAKEIRQIFLNTLPEYLEPVSQMLEQVLSGADGESAIRRALQTTLGSISAAASRVGILDVCSAVDEMRDRLYALEDELSPPPPELAQALREAFETLGALAGGGQRAEGAPKQTIVAALQHVEGVDKSVLERLTAAGLVTVDQLRVASAQEVVAVTGLDAKVVKRLLELLLGSPGEDRSSAEVAQRLEPAGPAAAAAPAAPVPAAPKKLADQLRAQVEIEASVDELRAEILRERLRIAALKERVGAAERQRDRLERELSQKREHLNAGLVRLSGARVERERLESERVERLQALETMTRRIAALRAKDQAVSAERAALRTALSGLSHRIEDVTHGLEDDR